MCALLYLYSLHYNNVPLCVYSLYYNNVHCGFYVFFCMCIAYSILICTVFSMQKSLIEMYTDVLNLLTEFDAKLSRKEEKFINTLPQVSEGTPPQHTTESE